MEKCWKFDSCGVSLCPLTKEFLKYGIWYPDEEICTSKKYGGHDWIKRQRKIARRTRDITKYYTFEMLKRNCIIKTGITGLDPDKEEAPQLKIWLKKHPPKKELSEEEKAQFQERMKRVRALK